MTYRPRHLKCHEESIGRTEKTPTDRSVLRRAIAGTAITVVSYATIAPALAEQDNSATDENTQADSSIEQVIDFTAMDSDNQADSVEAETDAEPVDEAGELDLDYVELDIDEPEADHDPGTTEDVQDSQVEVTSDVELENQANDDEVETVDQKDNTKGADQADDEPTDDSSKNEPTNDQPEERPVESSVQPEDLDSEEEPSQQTDTSVDSPEVSFDFNSPGTDDKSQPAEAAETEDDGGQESDDNKGDARPDSKSLDLGFTSLEGDEPATEEDKPANDKSDNAEPDDKIDLGFVALPELDDTDDNSEPTEPKAEDTENDKDEFDLGFTSYDLADDEDESNPAEEAADLTEQKPKPEAAPESEEEPKMKSNSEVAAEVLDNKWGVDEDRVDRLKEAGYDPSSIQKEVNNMVETGWLYTHDLEGQISHVVEYAYEQGGKGYTYRLGAGTQDGPSGSEFDCSSFTSSSWKEGAGIDIGRSAQDQWDNAKARGQIVSQGHSIEASALQPGDLILEAFGRRGPVGDENSIDHVIMYIGNGETVEWSSKNNGFAKRPARVSGNQTVGAIRPAAPDGSNN